MAFPTNELSIDGKPYRIADESRLGTRRRTYVEAMRPSQPSESLINTKTWRLSGPIGNSRQLSPGAPLGVDYTVNLDGRNAGLLTSAAARQAVTLSTPLEPSKSPPTSTVAITNWVDHLGGGGDAHDDLNSYGSPVDVTYWSTTTSGSAYLIVGIGSPTDPGVDSGHVVRARVVARNGTTGTIGAKLRLYDSTTVVATSDEYILQPVQTVSRVGAWTIGQNSPPSHSNGAGSNRMMVAIVAGDHDITNETNPLTALTYGGQALVFHGAIASAGGSRGERRIEVWCLDEDGITAATSTTLTPTWSQGSAPSDGVSYSLATFANVHQSSPIADDALDQDKKALVMGPLTVGDGDYVVGGALHAHWHSGHSWTLTAGYTEHFDSIIGESYHHIQDKPITADGLETVTATLDDTTDERGVGIAFVLQGAATTEDSAQNLEFAVPESAITTLGSYATLRIGISASTLNGTDSLRVTEMEFELPSANSDSVGGIEEHDGQLFIHRGAETIQVNPGDMSEVGSAESHGNAVVGSVASWLGAGYVGFGGAQDIKRRTNVSAGAGATYSTISNVRASHMAVGSDRIWMVEADGGVDDGQVKFAVDSVTASANLSNGIRVADPDSGHITGIYTLGDILIAGTQRGARSFTEAGAPAVLGEAVALFPSAVNGAVGASLWGWHYHATKLGLYAIQPQGPIENPVGPGEGLAGQNFEGPIDGYPVAVAAFKDSLWCSYLSTEGDSWLLRGVYGPQTAATGRPEWFVFRKLEGVECRAIGATSGRMVPTVVWGEDGGISYSDLAFRGREIADTAHYTFSADGGEWYGTTLVLTQGLVGNVRWAKFYSENCNTTNKWQLSLSANEGGYVDVGGEVQTNGLQTVRPATAGSPVTSLSFSTLRPRLAQTAASTTRPPQIRGDLVVAFDERPEHVREIDVLIELAAASELEALQDLVGTSRNTPVAVRLPYDHDVNTDRYAFVRSADVQERADPNDLVVLVKLVEWPTS